MPKQSQPPVVWSALDFQRDAELRARQAHDRCKGMTPEQVWEDSYSLGIDPHSVTAVHVKPFVEDSL